MVKVPSKASQVKDIHVPQQRKLWAWWRSRFRGRPEQLQNPFPPRFPGKGLQVKAAKQYQGKIPKQRFPNEGSYKVPKVPGKGLQIKVAKQRLPSKVPQAKVPK